MHPPRPWNSCPGCASLVPIDAASDGELRCPSCGLSLLVIDDNTVARRRELVPEEAGRS
jgi:DNA-directed RNA polymerase subunit RPC12/RpoP